MKGRKVAKNEGRKERIIVNKKERKKARKKREKEVKNEVKNKVEVKERRE